MIYSSGRMFQLWDYTVSHQQMLLRSPIMPAVADDNIDIFLWGVAYVDLPTRLDGLSISWANPDEASEITRLLPGSIHSPRVFCFESNSHRYRIAASGLEVLRNQLDIFDSTIVYYSRHPIDRDRGEVIAHARQAPEAIRL